MGEQAKSQPGKGGKSRREASKPWLVWEIVAEFVFVPIVRGAGWLFLHLVLAIKVAFIKLFLS